MSEIGVGEVAQIRISNRGGERIVRVPKFVINIPPITESSRVRTREDLARVVESPLLPAAQALYDLNIETTSSSANYQDVEGRERAARLIINFDSLSPENQQIAEEFHGQPERGRRSVITGEFGSRSVQI